MTTHDRDAYHLRQHHWRALHQPRATVSHFEEPACQARHSGGGACGFLPYRHRESANLRTTARTAQKIRRREQGHEYTAAQLVALGAPRPQPGCDPPCGCATPWSRSAPATSGSAARTASVFRLGRTRQEREEIELVLTALRPYPKRPDPEPAAA
ncbi:hypothetical protein [Streptomyces sp. NPDC002758]